MHICSSIHRLIDVETELKEPFVVHKNVRSIRSYIYVPCYVAVVGGLAQRRLLVLPLLVAAVAHRLPEDDELGRQGRRCPWSWPPSPSTWPWSASPLLQQVEDHVLIFLNGRHVQAALACNAAMQAEDKWQIKTDRKLTVPDLDVVRQLLVDPEQVAAEAGHAAADVEHHTGSTAPTPPQGASSRSARWSACSTPCLNYVPPPGNVRCSPDTLLLEHLVQ